jgi:GTP pyrophosphokinase
MILAMTGDVRVILIKLADRLHNIRTLAHLDPEKRMKISRETLEIYAPIAHRLGMGKIRDELEDVSFQYTYPDDYQRIRNSIGDKYEWAIQQLEGLKKEILKLMFQYRIPAEIEYRIKREISIYRKQQRQNVDLDQVYDLMALRIITDTVANCYAIMGMIHQQWTHIPSRWRDFITNPKSNYYQSIHTTIITRQGVKFEIQIRTRDMHRSAEEGIAAHWKYKEGMSFIENDNRLQWFREMIEYHKTNPDPKEFLSLVKKDLTPNEIYVFTPKGKVINLKSGSTPIDFAYAIHSEIGDHCKNAIVNEKLTPLKTPLHSGDVIEIVTGKNSTPSSDWLKFAVTTKAKRKIMSYLQREETNLQIERGRRLWQRILREYQKKYRISFTDEDIQQRIAAFHYPDMETFLRDIGSGKKTLDRQTLKALFPELTAVEVKTVRKAPRKPSLENQLITVEGQDDIVFTIARCCSPIKGDEIIGYMTKNRGLVIHQKDCPNFNSEMPLKIKRVSWSQTDRYAYKARFELIIDDKPGMLSSITSIIAQHDSNIKKIDLEQLNQAMVRVKIILEVRDTFQLNRIYEGLKSTAGIYSVIRKKVA